MEELNNPKSTQTASKKPNVWKIVIITLVCILMCLASFGIGYGVRSATYPDEIRTIDYILSNYKKYNIDQKDNIVELFERSILDRYSNYYTKEEYEQIKKASIGRTDGIGIVINSQTLELMKIIWNSPSDRANMRVGGVIKAIKSGEGEFVSVTNGDEFQAELDKLDAYQEFTLKVNYGGESDEEHTLMREEYTETYARYYDLEGEYGCRQIDGTMEFSKVFENSTYDLENQSDVAVIAYRAFNGLSSGLMGSAGQFECALSQFKASGKKKLILDLRNNGGGYLEILSSVASHLIGAENGSKVPVIIEKDNKDVEKYHYSGVVDSDSYNFESIVVLVDEGSASASEALVGAMLDYDDDNIVKIIVEENQYYPGVYKSYGKGIMQTTFENFLTGEAIKLTTAKLFWPKSEITIHELGISEELNSNEYFKDVKKVYSETSAGCVHDALSLSK